MTLITPQRLPRFGIEGNEALGVGAVRIFGRVRCRRSRTGGLQTESENLRGIFFF